MCAHWRGDNFAVSGDYLWLHSSTRADSFPPACAFLGAFVLTLFLGHLISLRVCVRACVCERERRDLGARFSSLFLGQSAEFFLPCG